MLGHIVENRVVQDSLLERLHDSDIGLLANARLEALACGTPIVISDAGGAREVVASRTAGRIVNRDPASFAAAIADLLATSPDPEAVRTTARLARRPAPV